MYTSYIHIIRIDTVYYCICRQEALNTKRQFYCIDTMKMIISVFLPDISMYIHVGAYTCTVPINALTPRLQLFGLWLPQASDLSEPTQERPQEGSETDLNDLRISEENILCRFCINAANMFSEEDISGVPNGT